MANEERPNLDCGDSGCKYASPRTGMRTNGGCRCDQCPLCEQHIRFGHRAWCQFPERSKHVLAQNQYIVTAAEKRVLEAARDWFHAWGSEPDLGMMDGPDRRLYEALREAKG